jgi:hypothetical protein
MTFRAYLTEEDVRKSRFFHVWEADNPDDAIQDTTLIDALHKFNAEGFFLEGVDKAVIVEWVKFE